MNKFLVLLIFWPIGFLIIRYRSRLKDLIGNVSFAEKYLGSGGTNTFIVLLGLLTLVLSLMYVLGTLQAIFGSFLGPLFGQ